MSGQVNSRATQLELQLASAMAKHLLSASTRFENPLELSRASMRDGMKCLANLDKTTKLSLPILPPQEPAGTQAISQPVSPVQYNSSREEYLPALKRQEVIRALLDLQQRGRQPRASLQSRAQNAKPGPSRIFRPRGPVEGP